MELSLLSVGAVRRAALMSGNAMLLKHAPGVPQCAVAFEQLLKEAGLPDGVYTNLFLSNDQAGALIDDPRVKRIALTGSERAGEVLASRRSRISRSPQWSWAEATRSLSSMTPTWIIP